MDGDWPDLERLAKLKESFEFFWILKTKLMPWDGMVIKVKVWLVS